MRFDQNGHEVPDNTPVEIPLGAARPESLAEMVRRMVRTQVSMLAQNEGIETFEEASDFEIEDDDAELRLTAYEEMADEVPTFTRAGQRGQKEAPSGKAAESGEEGEGEGVPEEAD